MFRDGQYLEVIKASDNCLATIVVTVEEKTIEIKKKRVSTNKWLDLEDWAALYKILERAILRNVRTERLHQDLEKCEWKKSTRQLDITYTFEQPESIKDVASLPTIRVHVSPARKRSENTESAVQACKKEKSDFPDRTRVEKTRHDTSDENEKDFGVPLKLLDTRNVTVEPNMSKKKNSRRYLHFDNIAHTSLEEYVPDGPTAKKLCADLKYVPSRKSALEGIQTSSNEYTPTVPDNKSVSEVIRYIPNSVGASQSYETYEPDTTMASVIVHEEYVPTSKGAKPLVEEYQPDFTSKSMKFDNSYVPSSVQLVQENSRKSIEKLQKFYQEKHSLRKKGALKKKMDLFP